VTNVAALDCGSNSTRLLIADEHGHPLVRLMRITRLSEGVDARGTLTETAMARTLQVLAEYRTLMDEHQVARGLLVATSAVRDASNGREFLEAARATVGVEARLLTGDEEATFSYTGATATLEPSALVTMIVDIGGGSTELAALVDGTMVEYSMQLGCVRVTERALGAGIVAPERERAARDMIRAELDRALETRPALAALAGRVRLVGLAGTVATLSQMAAGLTVYDRDAVHHQVLSLATVRHWRDELARRTPQERLTLAGMVPGREDVLCAGLFILEAVMERFQVTDLITSEDDILDGIVASLRA